MAPSTSLQILPLADFSPAATSRAWVSAPNPNNLPLIATATSDKKVRVYSLSNFTLHSTIEGGHERTIRTLAWRPWTGKKSQESLTVATGSFDSTMAIWRRRADGMAPAEQREVHAVASNQDAAGGAFEVEIGLDGHPIEPARLMRRDDDEDSDDDGDWTYALALEGHDSEVKSVAYSPSGQFLASCSRDKSIWIWEEVGAEGDDEFETVAVLTEHTADVKCVCWRTDDGNGEVLASASYDDTIILWKEDGEGEWNAIATLEGHDGTVWSLAWEPIEEEKDREEDVERRTSRLLSGSADTTIKVWEKTTMPPPPNRPSYFNSIPNTMRAAPPEEKWTVSAVLPAVHELPIYSISWSATSRRVVSSGGDGRIAVYEEIAKGTSSVEGEVEKEWVVLAIYEGAHGPYEVNHVTWCKRFDNGRGFDGEEMVVSSGDDGAVRAWALVDGTIAPTTANGDAAAPVR